MVAVQQDLQARNEPRSTGLRPERPRRVAVVLNVHARRVDAETMDWIAAVVPGRDLYLSRTMEEGTSIAEKIMSQDYDVVLFGGGDGTFASGVAALEQAASKRGRELPEVGVLRLGTGNAFADAVGAGLATPEGVADDLRRARRARSQRSVTLLEVEGRPTMFCGFGVDAQILEDFGKTVGMLRRVGVAEHLKSAGLRYFLAVAGRSVPRFILTQRVEVVAINRGSPAIRVDRDGDPVGAPIAAGRVLWRGAATLASASSIPFYGLSMKMFPHADRQPGRFQLRMTDVSAAETLANLPAIWRGRHESDRLQDFLVDRVEIVLARPAPFQSGGDLVGNRDRVTIGLWDKPIAVV